MFWPPAKGQRPAGRAQGTLSQECFWPPAKRPAAKSARQRPTLPPGYPGSTIGAGGLNYRVRNGNGCLPSAMVTERTELYRGEVSGLPSALRATSPGKRGRDAYLVRRLRARRLLILRASAGGT